MSESEFVSGPSGAPDWLIDTALAATVAVFVADAFGVFATGFAISMAFTLHIFVSLYHGRFGRFRKAAWSVMFGGWLALSLIGPLTNEAGFPGFAAAARVLFPLASLVFILGIVLDFFALHGPRLRTRRVTQAALLVGLVAILAIAAQDVMRLTGALQDGNVSRLDHQPMIATDAYRPLVALLRAGVSLGVGPTTIVAVIAALGGLWAWRRVWRLHAPSTRRVFTCLWLAAVVGWVVLGFLGDATSSAGGLAVVVALALYEIAFLAATPLVLTRFIEPARDRRAEVFT